MKFINVCVPVLKRYDLLHGMLASLPASAHVHVIDNGRDYSKVQQAIANVQVAYLDVFTPKEALSVAASWNWFIEHVAEERVLVNDDLVFAPDSLEKLLAPSADVVTAEGCGFACFVLRDSCVNKIGVFDESISPGYAYYEDDDYLARMRRGGVSLVDIDCGVTHLKSQTLEANTPAEMDEHHRKFHIARANFVAKWGMMPSELSAVEQREAEDVARAEAEGMTL